MNSLSLKPLDIPLHSTGQPVPNVVLPCRAAHEPHLLASLPILETAASRLKAIVHRVGEPATLYYRMHQQQLALERLTSLRFLFILFVLDHCKCNLVSSLNLTGFTRWMRYISYLFILLPGNVSGLLQTSIQMNALASHVSI